MNYFKKLKLGRGFTLVEMLVVITIFTVILTALVINQNGWNKKLALKTASLEIGLVLRQAQINSLAVRESAASSGDKFDVGYGVYFDITNTTSYIYFADLDRDSTYDVGEELSVVPLKNDINIIQMCGFLPSERDYCTGSHSLSKIVILFRRPDSKARIRFLNSAGSDIASVSAPAEIEIRYREERAGGRATIRVQENGQIDS